MLTLVLARGAGWRGEGAAVWPCPGGSGLALAPYSVARAPCQVSRIRFTVTRVISTRGDTLVSLCHTPDFSIQDPGRQRVRTLTGSLGSQQAAEPLPACPSDQVKGERITLLWLGSCPPWHLAQDGHVKWGYCCQTATVRDDPGAAGVGRGGGGSQGPDSSNPGPPGNTRLRVLGTCSNTEQPVWSPGGGPWGPHCCTDLRVLGFVTATSEDPPTHTHTHTRRQPASPPPQAQGAEKGHLWRRRPDRGLPAAWDSHTAHSS